MDFEKMIAYVEEHKAEYFAKLLNRGGIGMNNDKIHVLKDESLGGIEREYVEVERNATVGDYVRHNSGNAIYKVNKIPMKTDDDCLTIIKSDMEDMIGRTAYTSSLQNFNALEPTDIVHIDGERYRVVDRKAEVGEKVLVVDNTCNQYDAGKVYEVRVSSYEDIRIDSYLGGTVFLETSEYRVLEPVYTCDNCDETLGELACTNRKGGSYCSAKCADEDDVPITVVETQASPEVLDLLANLARRVTAIEHALKTPTPFATQVEIRGVSKRLDSVESQLSDTQGNVERLAEEIAAGKPVVINTPNITVNKDVDVERIMQALAARLGGMSR